MKKTTLALGMHDKLFKRARTMYQIEHCICDLLMTKGFLRIETPTLEHFEVFSDVVDNGNYNFFDKNGDLISLRPDITSQIGRVIASTQVHTPIKFSYSGKVFNYNEEMRGLSNEHTQAGVEIIGFPVHQALEEADYAAISREDYLKELQLLDIEVGKKNNLGEITSLNFHMPSSCNSFLKN